MTEKKRTDFNYRQLENNLIYISESIIQAYKSNKCELTVCHEYDENDASLRVYIVDANLEKSFIELGVYFKWPNFFIERYFLPLSKNFLTHSLMAAN